jgi:hypothetical protein
VLGCTSLGLFAPRRPVHAVGLRLAGRQRNALHPLARQRPRGAGADQLGGALLDLDVPLREMP